MSKTAKDEAGKVLDSGYIGQGPMVDRFEEKLKSRFKNDYVVTTNFRILDTINRFIKG